MSLQLALKSLRIKRFRSVPSQEIVLDNPTFLVGQNGSGKSNVVDAFSFLAEAMFSPLQAVFDRRGGISSVRNRSSSRGYPPNLGLGVQLVKQNQGNGNDDGDEIRSATYAFEVRALKNHGFEVIREQCVVRYESKSVQWFERTQKSFRSTTRGIQPGLEPNALALPLLGGDVRFSSIFRFLSLMRVYSIEPSKLRDLQDPDSGVILRPDGSNAASVLQEIERRSKNDHARICELLESIVPQTTRVQTKKHGNKLSLEFTQEWTNEKKARFEAFNMSDGTLRALGLLMAIYQKPTPSVIVIEEPEATIHPGALGAVLDMIHHSTRQMQVVVTTHSPELLNANWIDGRHLRIASCFEGATRICEISEASRQALHDHLMGAGELLLSNALTPHLELFAHSPQQFLLFDDLD